MKLLKLLIPILLIVANAAQATDDKAALVDAVLKQSSIEISIMNMPSQLAQLPAMMPIEAQQKQQLMEDIVSTIMRDFNEVVVLDAVKNHFMVNGETQQLENTLSWLQSAHGREITQIEILAQQLDPMAMQQYVATFSPETLSEEQLAIFTTMVREAKINDMIFDMMEKFLPEMMAGFVELSKASNNPMAAAPENWEQELAKQVKMMRTHYGPMFEMQMIATMSYMFKDASQSALLAYNDFLASEAGQHYLKLTMDSVMEYGLDWMSNIMTGLAKVVVAESVN